MVSSLSSNVQLSPKLQEMLDASRKRLEFAAMKIQIREDTELDVIASKAGFNGDPGLSVLRSPFFEELTPAYYVINTKMPLAYGIGFQKAPQHNEGLLLVSYIPDNCAAARIKMLYASSLPVLRSVLGDRVLKEYQFTSKLELDAAQKEKPIDRHAYMSEAELRREQEIIAEEVTRKEQAKELESRLGLLGRPFTLLRKTPALQEEDRANHAEDKDTVAAKSGGFHNIQLPFTECARQALLTLKSSQHGLNKLVELAVTDDQKSIDLVVTKSVISDTEEARHRLLPICTDAPRFYVYHFFKEDGSPVETFIYSCPEHASPRTRMLYSSARTGAMHSAARLLDGDHHTISVVSVISFGLKSPRSSDFDLQLQCFDPSELTHQFVWDEWQRETTVASEEQNLNEGFMPLKAIKRISRPKGKLFARFSQQKEKPADIETKAHRSEMNREESTLEIADTNSSEQAFTHKHPIDEMGCLSSQLEGKMVMADALAPVDSAPSSSAHLGPVDFSRSNTFASVQNIAPPPTPELVELSSQIQSSRNTHLQDRFAGETTHDDARSTESENTLISSSPITLISHHTDNSLNDESMNEHGSADTALNDDAPRSDSDSDRSLASDNSSSDDDSAPSLPDFEEPQKAEPSVASLAIVDTTVDIPDTDPLEPDPSQFQLPPTPMSLASVLSERRDTQ